jgi:hypothetical protein
VPSCLGYINQHNYKHHKHDCTTVDIGSNTDANLTSNSSSIAVTNTFSHSTSHTSTNYAANANSHTDAIATTDTFTHTSAITGTNVLANANANTSNDKLELQHQHHIDRNNHSSACCIVHAGSRDRFLW